MAILCDTNCEMIEKWFYARREQQNRYLFGELEELNLVALIETTVQD